METIENTVLKFETIQLQTTINTTQKKSPIKHLPKATHSSGNKLNTTT
jgi:hypothetical protein